MNCEEYLPLISGHLDGENSEIEERRLQEHLKTCEACRALLSQMERNDALLKDSTAQPPADLTERIMRQVRKEKQSSVSRKKRWIPVAFSGVAAAALLGLVFWGKLPVLNPSKDAGAPAEEAELIETRTTAAATEEACGNTQTDGAALAESTHVSSIMPMETEALFRFDDPKDTSLAVGYSGLPAYYRAPAESVSGGSGKRSNPLHYVPSAPMLIVWNVDDLDALADFAPEAPHEYTPLTANAVPSLYERYQAVIPFLRDFDQLYPADGYSIRLYTVPYETMMSVFDECAGDFEISIYYPAQFTAPDECSVVLIRVDE